MEATSVFRSAVVGLRFDEKLLSVRSVGFGDIFGPALANAAVKPFLNQNGRMFVSFSHPDGAVESSNGTIAFIEIEALKDGVPALSFEKEVFNVLTADGKNFTIVF
jgi:hypothetical protein